MCSVCKFVTRKDDVHTKLNKNNTGTSIGYKSVAKDGSVGARF